MSYRGFRGMSVDSFDGYDSTPYSGGYDLSLTYGRALQPSDEICYPVSLPGDVHLEPSAFETENAKNSDCYGLLRPGFQFQPQPVPNTGYPDYGHQSYGHGVSSGSGYGSVYCGRAQHEFIAADLGESERKPPQYESGGYGREGSRYQHQGLETEFWREEAGVKPPQYGFGDQNQSIGYRKPSYYEGEGYGHSIYGNNPEHVEKKHSHHHRHY